MSGSDIKGMHRRLFEEGLNRQDMTVIDALIAPNYVNYNMPAPAPGPEGFKQVVSMFFSAFPDMHIDIEDALVDGDKLAARGVMRGTHQGEFMGVPATGKAVTIDYIDIWRAANGKFTENWVQIDMLGLMRQLGAAG